MNAHLKGMLDHLAKDGRPGLHNSIAISWIRYETFNPEPGQGLGAGWSEQKLLYPASVVKLIYAIAIDAWIQKDLIPETEELKRAERNMIQDSSNDATSLILDLLSGTTSGPSLTGSKWIAWKKQRSLINNWLDSFRWEELKGINCCQKTWEDGPYGREKDFYGDGNLNRNALSTSATARLFEAVMTKNLISPPACKRLRSMLSRSLDIQERASNPENQIDGFLGESLKEGSRIWSKAGWMSQARNDAAWICAPHKKPMLVVIFSQGRKYANDTKLFPAIANQLLSLNDNVK